MVASGKADITMRPLVAAVHTIKTRGLLNLKIAGMLPNSANRLRIGVVKTDPVLRDILDKGVLSIGRAETDEIVNRHVPIKVESGVDQTLILKLLGGFAGIALVGGVYHVRLRRLHAELQRVSRTDALTGLANRATIDAAFAVELERNRRHERPLSILMVDIDHFKSVNDRFGHQAGDRVLKAVAHAIGSGVRLSDTVGRWGGEEFLVLCPETGSNEARALADRLRLAVRAATTDTTGSHSISVGVAGARSDDTVDALLRRADAALYRAKSDGRDCVRMG
jgi:diguanylate cyclase (GGDEF)-like protein